MRKLLAWALAATLTAPLAGCYTIHHAVEDSLTPVEFSHSEGDRRSHFSEEGRNFYILYGLLPIVHTSTDAMLQKYVRKGTRISNLRVEQAFTPMDFGLSLGINTVAGMMTMGFAPWLGILTRTVRYEGDVVNAPEEAAD